MKLKAVISNTAPDTLFAAFSSKSFATQFLSGVVGDLLGAKSPILRPAEYYVQEPDRIVAVDDTTWGVELRLTGVRWTPYTRHTFSFSPILNIYG